MENLFNPMTVKDTLLDKRLLVFDYISDLHNTDQDLEESVYDMLIHLSGTMKDKYVAPTPIDMKKFIYGDNSTMFNIGNACKYLQRFITTGFDKSKKKVDLLKVIHYCLFEYTNQSRNEEEDN